jgi:hypothetical protein
MTASENVTIGLEELMQQAKRLGLTPVYRQGTVFGTTTPGVSAAMVTLDNDTAPTRCYNFAGPLTVGDRVITIGVKPQGTYILGVSVPARRTYNLVSITSATCDSLLALTTTPADVSGTTLSITTLTPNAKWSATAFFDAQILGANNNTPRGWLRVDGVDPTSMALYSANFASSNNRATIGQTYEGTLTTAGSHTFVLRGDVTAGSGQWRFNILHTRYVLHIFE